MSGSRRRSRRRARSRDQESHWEEQDQGFDDDSDDENKPSSQVVDAIVFGARAGFGATRNDFKEAGFSCDRCGWATKKRGSSGRQAVRAHQKKHVRERRAVVRPLFFHSLVIAGAVALFLLAPQVAWSLAALGLPVPLALHPAWLHGWIPKLIAVIAPALGTIASWLIARRFADAGRKKTGRMFSLMLAVNVIFLFTASIVAGGLVSIPVWSGWLSGFILIAVSNLVLAPSISRLRLDMARRQYQPAGYGGLFRLANLGVEEKLNSYRNAMGARIRSGRINPGKFTGRQKKLMRALRLENVRPKPAEERPGRKAAPRTQSSASGGRQKQ